MTGPASFSAIDAITITDKHRLSRHFICDRLAKTAPLDTGHLFPLGNEHKLACPTHLSSGAGHAFEGSNWTSKNLKSTSIDGDGITQYACYPGLRSIRPEEQRRRPMPLPSDHIAPRPFRCRLPDICGLLRCHICGRFRGVQSMS